VPASGFRCRTAPRRRGRSRHPGTDARRLRDRQRQPGGWTSLQTLGLLGVAGALLAVFVAIEAKGRSPLVPLGLFRLRNVVVSNVVGILWAAAMFAWFFVSALYLQLVLGYSPLQVGLAFLPSNLIMGALSVGLSAKLVMRFGFRPPLAAGLLLAATGLLLFARAPVAGNYLVDVLPP
jgi:hypothetical protein